MQLKKHRLFRWIFLVAGAILSVILILALLVPLSYGSTNSYIGTASLQLARANGFAKNALILEYGPVSRQAQALSDLQVALPLFEAEQMVILHNNDQGQQDVLSQNQGNYLSLVTATSAITSESTIDPLQVAIIVDSSRVYNMGMNAYLMALESQANDFNLHLVLFQESIAVIVIILVVSLEVLWMRERRVIQ
jgi:hypothetical protein